MMKDWELMDSLVEALRDLGVCLDGRQEKRLKRALWEAHSAGYNAAVDRTREALGA